MSNARVAAAAETFVRRKIDEMIASLPHRSDHTPPRVPHPPSTKRPSKPRRWSAEKAPGKDRKSSADKEQHSKEKDSPKKDKPDDDFVMSSLALQQRDSLILSRDRVSTALQQA